MSHCQPDGSALGARITSGAQVAALGPDRYPAQIGVFCDNCQTLSMHDYVVSDACSKPTRLGYARAYMRTKGWQCDDGADLCPSCRPPPAEPSGQLVHIAGPDIQIGPLLRQRCAWCGAVLLDYDLTRMAVLAGQDPRPATWPPGELIAVDGPTSWYVAHEDGDELPAGACARLDPAVTK